MNRSPSRLWGPVGRDDKKDSHRSLREPVKSKARGLAVLIMIILTLLGCQSGYVIRQGWRQLTIRTHEIAISSPDLEKQLPPETAAKLRWVPRILEFAKRELGLEPGDSYTTYVDTQGKAVSYIVTAAHPFALIPFQWHFPFAGRVPYKGYFDETEARAEAKRLTQQGLETLVFPVAAYSTLGWFQDPVVSSMLEGSLADLVDVLIHETTHQTLYFPGHSSFNESLATFVAREGTIRFLSEHAELSGLSKNYLAEHQKSVEREELLLRLRNDLDALYRSGADEKSLRIRKAEIFDAGLEALRDLSDPSGGSSLRASNAALLAMARYHEFEPRIEALQKRAGGTTRKLMVHLKEHGPTEDPVAVRQPLSPEASSPTP